MLEQSNRIAVARRVVDVCSAIQIIRLCTTTITLHPSFSPEPCIAPRIFLTARRNIYGVLYGERFNFQGVGASYHRRSKQCISCNSKDCYPCHPSESCFTFKYCVHCLQDVRLLADRVCEFLLQLNPSLFICVLGLLLDCVRDVQIAVNLERIHAQIQYPHEMLN